MYFGIRQRYVCRQRLVEHCPHAILIYGDSVARRAREDGRVLRTATVSSLVLCECSSFIAVIAGTSLGATVVHVLYYKKIARILVYVVSHSTLVFLALSTCSHPHKNGRVVCQLACETPNV
jgi:hypothetical protein